MTFFLIAIAILVVLIILGVPVAYSMGITSIVYILMVNPAYLSVLPSRAFSGINSFILLAVPFFILAAEIMTQSGLSKKLFSFARLFVGRFRGGLAFVNIIASTIFGSISGSAIADISGLGRIEIEEMTRQGYDRDFSIAISAGSSLQSPLIPPSTTVMIYAGIMSISTGALLMAGLVPGLLIAALEIIYVLLIRKKRNFPRDEIKYSHKEKAKIISDGLIALVLPVIIVGGIISGIVTATEAAAVAVLYAIICGVLIFRNMNFKNFTTCFLNAAKTVGNIFMIIAFANTFAWVAAMQQVPAQIANALLKISTNPYVLLLLVNILLILVGMIMDVGAAVILFAPILAPAMISVGVNPVHFAMIMILNLSIGVLTPPVGLVLFTAVSIGKRPYEKVVRAFIPFIIISFVSLALVTLIPQLSTWVPAMLGYSIS